MRRLHTDIPLGSERSSGSAVRFPVMTTLLMFVAATARLPSGFVLFAPRLASGAARGGAEDVVPGGRADAEAARLVLKVVAHVPLPQDSAQPAPGAEMVQVVVGHVVDEIPGEEPRAERWRYPLAREQVDDAEDERAQRHADRRRHDQAQRVVGVVVVHP